MNDDKTMDAYRIHQIHHLKNLDKTSITCGSISELFRVYRDIKKNKINAEVN